MIVAAVLVSLGLPCGEPDVRVMSFNIRYATAQDGPNAWDLRKSFLLDTIREFGPDLLGTQETLAVQRDFLAASLPGYGMLAAGRDDGRDRGEMMALFYRTDRFEKLDGGHFWLSETPDVVGSKSWDSSLPRMVTWVKLRDRQAADSAPIAFFNTHFDHRGTTARLESARLIRKKIAEIAKGSRVVLTGDFNSPEGGEPYKALFTSRDVTTRLIDSYRYAHPLPEAGEGEGTFSGFKPGSQSGERIDWIGVSNDWTVREARIVRVERNGRTPSDHHPIIAILTARDPS